jgi:hypothetical protein
MVIYVLTSMVIVRYMNVYTIGYKRIHNIPKDTLVERDDMGGIKHALRPLNILVARRQLKIVKFFGTYWVRGS